jgi:hypothetical protein
MSDLREPGYESNGASGSEEEDLLTFSPVRFTSKLGDKGDVKAVPAVGGESEGGEENEVGGCTAPGTGGGDVEDSGGHFGGGEGGVECSGCKEESVVEVKGESTKENQDLKCSTSSDRDKGDNKVCSYDDDDDEGVKLEPHQQPPCLQVGARMSSSQNSAPHQEPLPAPTSDSPLHQWPLPPTLQDALLDHPSLPHRSYSHPTAAESADTGVIRTTMSADSTAPLIPLPHPENAGGETRPFQSPQSPVKDEDKRVSSASSGSYFYSSQDAPDLDGVIIDLHESLAGDTAVSEQQTIHECE